MSEIVGSHIGDIITRLPLPDEHKLAASSAAQGVMSAVTSELGNHGRSVRVLPAVERDGFRTQQLLAFPPFPDASTVNAVSTAIAERSSAAAYQGPDATPYMPGFSPVHYSGE